MEPEAAGRFARRALIVNAMESVEYVGLGKAMKRELMLRYGLTEQQAEAQLAAIVADLVEKIDRL